MFSAGDTFLHISWPSYAGKKQNWPQVFCASAKQNIVMLKQDIQGIWKLFWLDSNLNLIHFVFIVNLSSLTKH